MMGVSVSSCLYVILWLLCLNVFEIIFYKNLVYGQDINVATSICNLNGCNCTTKASIWQVVNCTFKDEQEVVLQEHDIPEVVLEIFISGGRSLHISPKTFDSHSHLNLLLIEENKNVIIDRQSFCNLSSVSLQLSIRNCETVTIKTATFESIQSSLQAEITGSEYVSVEKSAFNKLYKGEFKNIRKLVLDEGTFEFKNQNIDINHGALTIISFDNIETEKIPRQAFFSALAEVKIQNSKIGELELEAFHASQISTIVLNNSTIDYIRSGAFSSKTLIFDFLVSHCLIKKIETGAIGSAGTHLTVQFSRITEIESEAISNTIANVEITDNEIVNIKPKAFIFDSWTNITISQNIIKNLHNNFVIAPPQGSTEVFKFSGNEIYNIEPGALSFVPELADRILIFYGNSFNQTCHCYIESWIQELTNSSKGVKNIMNTSFCTVSATLSYCFKIDEGLINFENFTELVCTLGDTIKCEPYKGETKILNTTSRMFLEDEDSKKNSWLVLIITIIGLAVLAVLATSVFLLLKGGRWLKRKGYFSNMRYNQNEQSNDEENTIVTVDENEPIENLDLPEELSFEFLQELRKRLDDPNTKESATEMIERLYEMFIVEDSYENNNRQDEEAHLYEELGNLQQQLQQFEQEPEKLQTCDSPMSILRIMEEKFNNLQLGENDSQNQRPAMLVSDYAEPSDAAVHFYSELKQSRDIIENEKKDSLKSSGSGNMASRPLPDKPAEENSYRAGTSKT